MFELVYCSVAKPDLTEKDISDILTVSREFNDRNNITGCLIYYEDEFVQILEGEEKIVRELYGRIEKDHRHSEVTLISTEDKKERTFSNWTMFYSAFDDTHMSRMNEETFVNNLVSFSDLVGKPTQTVESFWAIAKLILTGT